MSVEEQGNLNAGHENDETEEMEMSLVEDARLNNMIQFRDFVVGPTDIRRKPRLERVWTVTGFDDKNVFLENTLNKSGVKTTTKVSRNDFFSWQDTSI